MLITQTNTHTVFEIAEEGYWEGAATLLTVQVLLVALNQHNEPKPPINHYFKGAMMGQKEQKEFKVEQAWEQVKQQQLNHCIAIAKLLI